MENVLFGEVCCDRAFTLERDASVRIEGEGECFGCYVKSYNYNRFDLQKFGGLTLSLYNTNDLTGEIILNTLTGRSTFHSRRNVISDTAGSDTSRRSELFPMGIL